MATKRKQAREQRPRPGVACHYPGEKVLRFRAALAGARLAKYLAENDDLAETIAQFFRLDRLNDTFDVADYRVNTLARLVNAAAVRASALRRQRSDYYRHLGNAIEKARVQYRIRRAA